MGIREGTASLRTEHLRRGFECRHPIEVATPLPDGELTPSHVLVDVNVGAIGIAQLAAAAVAPAHAARLSTRMMVRTGGGTVLHTWSAGQVEHPNEPDVAIPNWELERSRWKVFRVWKREAEIDPHVLVWVSWSAIATDQDLVLAIRGDLAGAARSIGVDVALEVEAPSEGPIRIVTEVDCDILWLGWRGERERDVKLILQHRELEILGEIRNVDARCEKRGALDVVRARVGALTRGLIHDVDGAAIDGDDVAGEALELHVEHVVGSKGAHLVGLLVGLVVSIGARVTPQDNGRDLVEHLDGQQRRQPHRDPLHRGRRLHDAVRARVDETAGIVVRVGRCHADWIAAIHCAHQCVVWPHLDLLGGLEQRVNEDRVASEEHAHEKDENRRDAGEKAEALLGPVLALEKRILLDVLHVNLRHHESRESGKRSAGWPAWGPIERWTKACVPRRLGSGRRANLVFDDGEHLRHLLARNCSRTVRVDQIEEVVDFFLRY